mmetsp:Transcript_61908/g.195635  ORF Transcript_61908/g.195635 Transcript_61908/m.195635 type:complete len:321 (+) Transcript_61908:578-1540(+)
MSLLGLFALPEFLFSDRLPPQPLEEYPAAPLDHDRGPKHVHHFHYANLLQLLLVQEWEHALLHPPLFDVKAVLFYTLPRPHVLVHRLPEDGLYHVSAHVALLQRELREDVDDVEALQAQQHGVGEGGSCVPPPSGAVEHLLPERAPSHRDCRAREHHTPLDNVQLLRALPCHEHLLVGGEGLRLQAQSHRTHKRRRRAREASDLVDPTRVHVFRHVRAEGGRHLREEELPIRDVGVVASETKEVPKVLLEPLRELLLTNEVVELLHGLIELGILHVHPADDSAHVTDHVSVHRGAHDGAYDHEDALAIRCGHHITIPERG